MADDGFTPQVEWILRHVTGEHQTMLFSATLDGDVAHLVRRYLKNPVEVSVDNPTDTVGTMRHLFLGVHHMDKARVVASLSPGASKTVVFCGTKRVCDKARHLAPGARRRRRCDPRRPAADRPREGDAPVRQRRAVRARGDRRRRPRHRHRRRRHRRPLRAGDGRQGVPAPLGPHRSRRARRLGRHARRVQPAHDVPDRAAGAADGLSTTRSRSSPTTVGCAHLTDFGDVAQAVADMSRRPPPTAAPPAGHAESRSSPADSARDCGMRAAGVHHVSINVTDVPAAALLRRRARPHRAHRPPRLRVRRGVARRRRPAGAPDRGAGARSEGQHFALRVDDLDAAIAEFRAVGSRSATPSRSAPTARRSCTTRPATWSSCSNPAPPEPNGGGRRGRASARPWLSSITERSRLVACSA